MATINKINVGGTNYDVAGSLLYGVCSTDSEAAAKEVTVNGNFTLQEGAMVAVKFVEANGVASPTLNVNATGAKPIKVYGSTAAGTSTTVNSWVAGAVQIFIYDGTNWIRDYWRNTTYTNVSLGQGYATCSTAAATVAKAATLSSYSLTTGGIVSVKFTNDVPASATLNINGKGAKAIRYRGSAITAGIIKAGDTATFIYSSYYHLISVDRWGKDLTDLSDDIYYQWLYLQEMGALNNCEATSTDGVAYTAETEGFTSDELAIGYNVIVIPNKTSTSTQPTLAIGNTPAKGIRIAQADGSGVNDLPSAGFLVANTPYHLTYNGTYWVIDQPAITGAASTIAESNLTASRTLVSDANGKVAVSAVTSTELGYLDGVTSAIQTQINNKATKATSLSGYGITDAYTKTEADSAIAAAIESLKQYIGNQDAAVLQAAQTYTQEQLGVIENGTY